MVELQFRQLVWFISAVRDGGKRTGTRLGLLLAMLCPALVQAQGEPQRQEPAAETRDRLSISGSFRLRYESMDNTFRLVGPGQDELLLSRLLVHAQVNGERFYGGFELQDSRAWLEQDLTPVGTDDVNALEPLRAYVGYRNEGLDIQAGRMTMDVGSRRLVSRNRMRNTINAFTGVHAKWSKSGGIGLQAFLTMPVARLPNNLERERLRNNEFELDQEHWERILWGLHASDVIIGSRIDTEWYLFGIREKDRPSLPTRNRDFLTAGLRARNAGVLWAFELETAIQHGTSRASILPTDTTDLDHRAWFIHAEASRKLQGSWEPRVIFRFDYASGDEDPDDGEFNRFDTLYGDRRWEFGPTGIYGALTRSNILSPGIALRSKPGPSTDFRIDYRPAWLASDRDFMPTALLRDRDGNSGSFIGHQVDLRWRWWSASRKLNVDFTAAYLWKGEFLKVAPGAPPSSNTAYAYISTAMAF
jgi:hypothetical protein